jgi:hypothetical protein
MFENNCHEHANLLVVVVVLVEEVSVFVEAEKHFKRTIFFRKMLFFIKY